MNRLPVPAGAPLIVGLIDRSWSMAPQKKEMEQVFNKFISDQAALPGAAGLMVAQFADGYEVLWPMRPLAGAPKYRMELAGGTKFYDALGRCIGDVIGVLSEETAWRQVVVVVVTDGQDVDSKEWTRETVRAWVEHQQTHYRWKFVFLGANLDAVKVAAGLGIPAQGALTFRAQSPRNALAATNRFVAEVRAGGTGGFTQQDRQKAIEP